MNPQSGTRLHPLPGRQAIIWLLLFFGVMVWSYIEPKDRMTWWLEAIPAIVGFAIMLVTARRFPLTPLLYWLILAHSIVLFVGAHYTYAEVPLFNWVRDYFGHQRNNYDKLGHFMQGFVPAMIAREILIRLKVICRRSWLPFIVLCIVLAISAFYELIEWWTAVLSGDEATAFLATQGYVWDTQSDMLMALIGGATALLLLSRLHDRQLSRLVDSTMASDKPDKPKGS
jgi:putative membrane protein